MAATKISALPAATTISTSDSVPIVQGGTTKVGTFSMLNITSVKDGTDATKVLNFDVSAIATATTRTLSYPNANTSIPVIPQTLTITGPTTARTITVPDANFTVARTDSANSFTGVQTMTSPAITGPTTLTEAVGSSDLILTGATQTTSFPVLSATQTWNAGGVTFTGIKLNVTSSASAGGSMLQDWQVAGSSVANIVKDGSVNCGNVLSTNAFWGFDTTAHALVSPSGVNGRIINFGGAAATIYLCANMELSWTSTALNGAADGANGVNKDTGITRNGANILEVNTGTAISGTTNAATIKALTFCPAGTATTCTGATIGTGSKSNAGFVTSTTTGTTTCVVTFPFTAPTGWNIIVNNGTTPADVLTQTASTTTTATFVGTTVTGDVIRYIAMPY